MLAPMMAEQAGEASLLMSDMRRVAERLDLLPEAPATAEGLRDRLAEVGMALGRRTCRAPSSPRPSGTGRRPRA